MKLNSKGQVTIPADLRHKHGFTEGDDVEVIEDGDALRIVHASGAATKGERVVARVRGTATTKLSTDELMELLRAE